MLGRDPNKLVVQCVHYDWDFCAISYLAEISELRNQRHPDRVDNSGLVSETCGTVGKSESLIHTRSATVRNPKLLRTRVLSYRLPHPNFLFI